MRAGRRTRRDESDRVPDPHHWAARGIGDPVPRGRILRELGPRHVSSRTAIAEALADRSTFNAIHTDTSFKFDFFVKGTSSFDAVELERSVRQGIGDPAGRLILIKSPEDTVLRKLDWFRRGGSVSDRQWLDVVSVLRSSGGQLDETYLDQWAKELGVSDLLGSARQGARQNPA